MAWDQTKPANNSALVSSEVRGNFASIQVAFGNIDTTPLQQKATNFTALPTGFGMPVYTRVTADVTVNNTTVFASVTGASFAVAANEQWSFEFVLKVLGTNAASVKWQLTGPAAPTGIVYGCIPNSGALASAAAAFSTAIFSTLQAAELLCVVKGNLRNGANAGTVQLQFAQQAAEVSNLIVRAESYIITTRMA